jgi:3-hydroxyanthranilate 3,4-dioxygenase
MTRRAFNFGQWIDANQEFLKPPVGNRHLFDEPTDMVVMVIGGPNQRTDYHDDPVDEFFYQVRGDMILKLNDDGDFYDVPIREGEVFYLPPHIRHSPQRPVRGSVGLVLEGKRGPDQADGFEWFCFNCGALVHRAEAVVTDIVKDLPPLFNAFYFDETKRRCDACGEVHPGKDVPEGWVDLSAS